MKPLRLRLALAPLALFIALVALLAVGLGLDPKRLPSPFIGRPVPQFALPALEGGGQVSSADYDGQVWVLNVWASWCLGCRQELPYLALLRENGATIVGLNYKDADADARAWLKQFGNPFDAIPVDADGAVGIEFGVYALPETFIIDAAGVIVYKHIGAIDDEGDYQDLAAALAKAEAGG